MGAFAATGDAGKPTTAGTTNGRSGGRGMGAGGSGGLLGGGAGAPAGGVETGAGGGGSGMAASGAGGLPRAGSGGAALSSGGAGAGGMTGISGAAGASSTAGMAGVVGEPPLGPELTDVTKLTPKTCSIMPAVSLAASLALVGVAQFTTDFEGAERAIIQFGKTESYTLEAPVDWAAPAHRTWLLGMPAQTTVHYRVVVLAGGTACIGADATYETGAAPDGTPPNVTLEAGTSPAKAAPGFIIGEKYTGSGEHYFAYIVNGEGEVVWAHQFPITPTRALMSWDGKYLYARDLGATVGATGGSIFRVAMDGSGETVLQVPGGAHHDLVAIPTGFAYIARAEDNACDHIFTADPDGTNAKSLVDLDAVFSHFTYGAGTFTFDHCHVNAIRYYRDDDSYSVSDREKDVIGVVSGQGAILGSVGAKPTSDTPNHAIAEGADSEIDSVWRVQHGHDLYQPNKLILWSNGIYHDGTSHVLHYTLTGATAQLDWQYTGAGNSPTGSDAQHLPNGNFIVTNTRTGDVHELDETGKLVRVFRALANGYACHRSTLYGPPPGR